MDDPRYTIRRPRPGDLDGLRELAVSLWDEEEREIFTPRWWWNSAEPQCWIAECERTGEIAAICGARRTRFLLTGSVKEACAINDWYVSPHHAGHGLGRKLVDRSAESAEFLYTSAISDSAATGFSRLGWVGDVRIPMLVAVPALSGSVFRRPYGGLTVQHTEVDSADAAELEAADAIWNRLEWERPAMNVRDSSFVREQIALSGGRRYTLLVGTSANTGRELGYLIYRVLPPGSFKSLPRVRVGLISDYLVSRFDLETLRALALESSRRLAREKVPLALCLAADPEHQRAFGSVGFMSSRRFGTRLSRRLSSRSMHKPPSSSSPVQANWHMTFADNDTDLILGAALEREGSIR